MAATSEPPNRSISDVPDILHLVFSYLDPDNHFRDEYDQIHESRRSLALAARTCWGFAGPALDVLWKRLPDDQPLADLLCEVGIATRQVDEEGIKLTGRDKPGRYRLPSHFDWVLDDEPPHDQRWRMSRGYDIRYLLKEISDPRTHPGWPRFVEYASRVRGITLFAFDEPARSGVWQVLRGRIEDAPILPRLQSVDFYGIPTRALKPSALALLSRSVRKLSFDDLRRGARDTCLTLTENERALFSQSLNSAPSTDKLRLEIRLERFTPPLLQTHCSHIRHLEIFPSLTLNELHIFTKLPVLQQLSVTLAGEDAPDASPTSTFKTLTNLDVEGSWVKLESSLHIVHLPSLHTLSVTGKAFGKPAVDLARGAVHFFNTLSARHASLTSLSIRELPPLRRSPTPPGWVLTSGAALLIPGVFEAPFLDLIHPLLSLSALRHFSLSVPTHYNLVCTGADLRALAEAFRGLESFHLRMYRPLERPRGGPLDALEHFAHNCPRLRVLHLPSMEMAEESLAMVNVGVNDGGLLRREPHGLQMLVIPKVLLPPGRADLAGEVSELVRQVFPLAAAPFRRERLEMKEDWVVLDSVWKCPDPGCAPTWWKLDACS